MNMITLKNQIPQGWGTVSASNAVKIPYKSPPIPGGGRGEGGRGEGGGEGGGGEGGGGVVGHAIDRCISMQEVF